MGCGYIQNDIIFRIGVVQIRHAGMNKENLAELQSTEIVIALLS